MTKDKKELKQESASDFSDSSTDEEKFDKQEAPVEKPSVEETKKVEESKKEDIERLRGKLSKAEEERENYKKGMLQAKDKIKELETATPPSQSWESQDEEEPPDWYLQRERERLKKEKGRALEEFVQEHFNLQSANDLNDANWTKFKNEVDRYGLKGETKEEIKKELAGFYRMAGLDQSSQTPSSGSPVEDSGIGETTTRLKTQEKKPDALTRKLTEEEKKAAQFFPGGEVAYRKKLAERETLRAK